MSSDEDGGAADEAPKEIDAATVARALQRLPVFPLPDVVLFPHALLPLHVFEERYRKLVRDALDSNRLIGVPLLLDEEVAGAVPPRFAHVLGMGEIVMAQELPDGRYNLVLRGRARVRVEQELVTDEPYRLVVASEVPDYPPRPPEELSDAEESLRSLMVGLAEALPEG